MNSKMQPWIVSSRFDLVFIVGPALFITALVLGFQDIILKTKDVPPWIWMLLIVGVDVSHVYSTIFRTYLDKEELQKRQALYFLAPLTAWIVGCFLYSIDGLVFWRVLAYLAVFHFVRQQYGFMMLYDRGNRSKISKYIDQAVIYLATIYPLVYWHTHARNFDWFVEGDFLTFKAAAWSAFIGFVYAVLMAMYVVKETAEFFKTGYINVPKNLLLTGTAISWYVGIIAFNNDIAFTATNVIAHGVPYTALIWVYGYNQNAVKKDNGPYIAAWIGRLFRKEYIPAYLAILFMAAFFEEGLWDGFLWREHGRLFGFSNLLPPVQSDLAMVWIVPLLTLPQATHYILDAFIWRKGLKDSQWTEILFFRGRKSP